MNEMIPTSPTASALFKLRSAIHVLALENAGELDECEVAVVDAFNELVGDMVLPIRLDDYKIGG